MKKIFLIVCVFFGLTMAVNAQVKVGSNPSTIATTSNLEVEATNGGKVTITRDSAKVIIKDGTQGKDRILVSDVNGKASWKEPNEANMAQLVLRAYNPNTLQPTGVHYQPNVPLISGDGANYNASNGTFTVTTAGFYEYNLSLEALGQPGQVFTVNTSLGLNDGIIRGQTGYWNARGVSGVKWFESGETIDFTLSRERDYPFNATNWKVRRISVVIFKR